MQKITRYVYRKLFVMQLLLLIGSVGWGVSSVSAVALPDFAALAEKSSPAVVKIQIESNAPQVRYRPGGMPGESAPAITGMGSGFIVEADGYIVTNHHVIEHADRIVVRLNDRREFDAQLVGSDALSDIALLKVDAIGLPTLRLDTDDQLKVGEWVLAIGSPFGMDYSVSQGIVSAIGRSLPNDKNKNYVPFIQTDVAINPGNSGGPLFNLAGDVVGINSMIFSRSGGFDGLSFAIPSSVVRNVVQQLKEKGVVSRAWLGVYIQEVDKSLATSFGLSKPEGALIVEVARGGPADEAGILPGDIILALNHKPILYSGDLPHQIGLLAPGTRSDVLLVRHGKQQSLSVVVGELPQEGSVRKLAQHAAKGSAVVADRLGLQVEALRQGGVGVLVRAVKAGSAAHRAGLHPGDVIVQLGFVDVDTVATFQKIVNGLQSGSIQPVRFVREGRSGFRSIVVE